MDLVSIFLIIAIAADDILLLYNTYQLAPAMMGNAEDLTPAEKMRTGILTGKNAVERPRKNSKLDGKSS